jgi:hypothetical protein
MLRDAPARRVVNLYSGIFYNSPEQVEIFHANCRDNVSLSDDQRRECNKYGLSLGHFDCLIEIPPELDLPGIFHPTMGPKVNHHFRANNSIYDDFEHPRWGLIRSVRTIRPVKAGEELFTFYFYKKEWLFPNDFPWYFETKMKIERDERIAAEKLSKLENEKKKLRKEQKKRQTTTNKKKTTTKKP